MADNQNKEEFPSSTCTTSSNTYTTDIKTARDGDVLNEEQRSALEPDSIPNCVDTLESSRLIHRRTHSGLSDVNGEAAFASSIEDSRETDVLLRYGINNSDGLEQSTGGASVLSQMVDTRGQHEKDGAPSKRAPYLTLAVLCALSASAGLFVSLLAPFFSPQVRQSCKESSSIPTSHLN